MSSKASHEILLQLVKQVFRTFYPEHFIVVCELIRQSEFVKIDVLCERLNLLEPTVRKTLTDLKAKRFVIAITYLEHCFWGFDYHSFVNIVRYKIHMLKNKEIEKGRGKVGGGGYVCDKCGNEMSWDHFVKRTLPDGKPNEVCDRRACGGKLQKASKRAQEGLRALDVFSASLKKLEGQDIPALDVRSINAQLEEVTRNQAALDGAQYEMPKISTGQQACFVQIAPANEEEMDGYFLPPEMKYITDQISSASLEPKKAPIPPWLLPSVETTSLKEGDEIECDEREKSEDIKRIKPAFPVAESMKAYYQHIIEQVSQVEVENRDGGLNIEYKPGLDWETRKAPIVTCEGKEIPLNLITEQDIANMSSEEYKRYFEVYQNEYKNRLDILKSEY